MIRVSDRLWIADRALSESFVRASGPGGQNVNKLSTAVQLRLDLSASGLPEEVRARVARLAGKRLTQDGAILIIAQRHRTQERNRADALDRLIELVRRAAAPPKPRRATKPTFASKQRRLETKARRSRVKSARGSKPEVE
ncbi:MAG TPA: alternative ribosome rescue aminoacyl-tRNA hydrolase ArfB [Beijerinckiaceae bacterium]|jgi:ribosome-associated protein|nr:alternative ribosome rescue aminoacyl-tRNA hydrolase ArfB [Beijerinckiaceae bacterium]